MSDRARHQLMARRLADLHEIASRLGIARYRLLRKPDLADAILGALDEDGIPGLLTAADPASEGTSHRVRPFGDALDR